MSQVIEQYLQLDRIPQALPGATKHPIHKLPPQLVEGGLNALAHLTEHEFMLWGVVPLLSSISASSAKRLAHSGPRYPKSPSVTPPSTVCTNAKAGSRSSQLPGGSILPKGGKAIVSWSKPRLKDDAKTGKVVFTVGKEIPKKDDSKI